MILTPHVLHISLWLWCLVLDAEYVDIIHCGSWKINFVTNCLIVNTKRTWIVKISVSRVHIAYWLSFHSQFPPSLFYFLIFSLPSHLLPVNKWICFSMRKQGFSCASIPLPLGLLQFYLYSCNTWMQLPG